MPGMPREAVSVLVVDDQAPFRTAARRWSGQRRALRSSGRPSRARKPSTRSHSLKPDLVLMDINMEGIGGIEATRRISEEYSGTEVILLSTYDEDDLPADARTCGALAYVHKERFGPDVLEQAWATGHQNGNS